MVQLREVVEEAQEEGEEEQEVVEEEVEAEEPRSQTRCQLMPWQTGERLPSRRRTVTNVQFA